ncbi:inner membrane protein [Escherichia coli]|uniref:Inner membrane protein n=1 Tax=Escherichia coli TaxID=562 RepID=A0A376TX99_ECOLX|nr:inner membrane protein [Escherichia coli]
MAGTATVGANASDNIRNAMNMLMEVALLVGSISQQLRWRVIPDLYRGCIYFLNDPWAVRYRKWRHRSWQ